MNYEVKRFSEAEKWVGLLWFRDIQEDLPLFLGTQKFLLPIEMTLWIENRFVYSSQDAENNCADKLKIYKKSS